MTARQSCSSFWSLAFIFVRLLNVDLRERSLPLRRKAPSHGPVRGQQVRTLAGVIRSVGVFLIVFLTGTYVLNEGFHINIAPLLASAGIAGLAIGFGAQTLVKDVINGFFILAENQFEVGDTIKAAGVGGVVEEITMRRTLLRDGDGTLHIIPNSAIGIVSNATRDWSQVNMHVAVDYSENSDRVVELLKQVAEAFYNDSAFKQDVVAEPQVPGIERVRGKEVDYLMTVKVRPAGNTAWPANCAARSRPASNKTRSKPERRRRFTSGSYRAPKERSQLAIWILD